MTQGALIEHNDTRPTSHWLARTQTNKRVAMTRSLGDGLPGHGSLVHRSRKIPTCNVVLPGDVAITCAFRDTPIPSLAPALSSAAIIKSQQEKLTTESGL